MNILFEGPDNAGKTTLAKHVHENTRFTFYYHPGGKPVDMDDEVHCLEHQASVMYMDRVIMDRCTAISQQVYNPDDKLNVMRMSYLNTLLENKNIIVIYARPSTDRLMRVQDFTWREGESEEHKQKIIENQHTFIERYDAIMRKVPHIAYDFEHSTGGLISGMLIRGLNGDEAAYKWLRSIMDYRSI